MQVTIVGLPGSGKTTVFNALTGGHAETGSFSGGRAAPNIGVVKVPDERLDRLAELFRPRRTTAADVTYVDDPANPTPADPWRDLAELELEFTLADLGVMEKRLEKLRTQGRHGSQAERELAAREEEVLRRLEPEVSAGTPLRAVTIDEDEERLLRGYRFLTQKPVLVVVNIDDHRLPSAAELEAAGRERANAPHTDVVALAAQIEAEIGELPADDARAFMEELGIAEPARGRVIRLTYALLGLFPFFTAGEDECRAWTLRRGATAVDAAAAIHSDLARGFIRAEVVRYEDLIACGSMAEARRRGVLRSEGKTYAVQDGDVLQILFNVAR